MVEDFVNEKDYTAMDVAAAFLAEILGTADGKDAGNNKEDFGDTGAEEGMVRLFNNSDKIMNFYINSTLLDNIAEEGAGTGVYNIKIYKQGEGDNDYSLLYDGMIGSGNNDILVSDQLLATLSGGESAGIKIIVTLDGESMDNSYMNKQGKIRLNVSAVQSGEPSTTVKTVKTGDSTMVMLYGTLAIIAGVACIGTITGLYARKRAKDNTISKKS